jgi:sec-independent protein translocase protein TatA
VSYPAKAAGSFGKGPSRNDKDRARSFTEAMRVAQFSSIDAPEEIMFELGPEKLLMLLLICLVLFGGKRIPEIGGSIGKGIREFKRGMSDIGDSVNRPVSEFAPAADPAAADQRQEPKRLTP